MDFVKRILSWLSKEDVYINDPVKILTNKRFLRMRTDEQKRVVKETVDQTKEVTAEMALLAHFYGIKPWERKKLTKIQKAGLLWNIPSVMGLDVVIRKQGESEVGMGSILDALDPTKAQEGISYADMVSIKASTQKLKKDLGV